MKPDESYLADDLRWLRDPTSEPPANSPMTIDQRRQALGNPAPTEADGTSDWVRDVPPSDARRQRRARGILAAAAIAAVLLLAVAALSGARRERSDDPLED